MNKETFKRRLADSTKKLIEFTEERSINPLSNQTKYLIVPNSRQPENHLNNKEVIKLSIINKYEGKELDIEQTASLLWDDGMVPLWINMSVYEVNQNKTVVELICSRRYRNDQDLNQQAFQYPPFSIGIPLPPNIIELKDGQKIDINWRNQFKRNSKPRMFASFLRRLFK